MLAEFVTCKTPYFATKSIGLMSVTLTAATGVSLLNTSTTRNTRTGCEGGGG